MLRLVCLSWITGISFLGSTAVFLNYFSSSYLLYAWLISSLILVLAWYRNSFNRFSIIKTTLTILCCLSTFVLGWQFSDQKLTSRLSEEVQQRQTVEGVVYISHLSEGKIENWRQKAQLLIPEQDKTMNILLYPKRIYDTQGEVVGYSTDGFKIGEFYQVTVDIKPAHSYINEGGFDQEKWLLQQNIQGTATVLYSEELSQQDIIKRGWYKFIIEQQRILVRWQLWIEKLRFEYRQKLLDSDQQSYGLLLGLLTGDRSGIDKDTIQLYQYMGISHLLAISGPHVLVLASLITWCMMQCLHLFMRRGYLKNLYLWIPKQRLYLPCFVLIVSFYVAFTGFEIPALRTWIIVVLCATCLWFRWKISPFTMLLLAATLILFIDCFSILSAAFWLSFGASAILLMIYQQIQHKKPHGYESNLDKFKRVVHLLWQSQWRIFIALLPIVLWQFKAVSLISPLINLVAIPFLSLVIVPLDIVAAFIWQIIPFLGDFLWWLSAILISLLNIFLKLIEPIAKSLYLPSTLTKIELMSLSIALLIFSLPHGLVHRIWGVFFIFPILLQAKQPLIQLDILDVGQGQSIVLRTQKHSLLIDTGGGSDVEGQMTMGDRVIVPFLRSQGITSLDEILLTHLDLDHRGGTQAVVNALDVKQLRSNLNDKNKIPSDIPFIRCSQGQSWQWERVNIEILWPLANDTRKDANESSCVLLVKVPMGNKIFSILMMGDAGWETEFHLLQRHPDLHADILVLGHHGSRHSSAYDFLKQVNPDLAISSAGIDNRYGHPTIEMMARLEALNISHLNTIQTGRIHIVLQPGHTFWQINYDRQTKKWLLP